MPFDAENDTEVSSNPRGSVDLKNPRRYLVTGLEENLKYVDGEIEGVVIRALKFFHDKRGWLAEIFRQDELDEDRWPTMMYVSSTLPGVARVRTSTWTRPTALHSLGHPTSVSTCGTRGRTAKPGVIARPSAWVPRIRQRSGFRLALFMPIATWAKSRVWYSMHPTGFTRDGARKSGSTRSDTKTPILPGLFWTDTRACW